MPIVPMLSSFRFWSGLLIAAIGQARSVAEKRTYDGWVGDFVPLEWERTASAATRAGKNHTT